MPTPPRAWAPDRPAALLDRGHAYDQEPSCSGEVGALSLELDLAFYRRSAVLAREYAARAASIKATFAALGMPLSPFCPDCASGRPWLCDGRCDRARRAVER